MCVLWPSEHKLEPWSVVLGEVLGPLNVFTCVVHDYYKYSKNVEGMFFPGELQNASQKEKRDRGDSP
jgi:hypothetical protein